MSDSGPKTKRWNSILDDLGVADEPIAPPAPPPPAPRPMPVREPVRTPVAAPPPDVESEADAGPEDAEMPATESGEKTDKGPRKRRRRRRRKGDGDKEGAPRPAEGQAADAPRPVVDRPREARPPREERRDRGEHRRRPPEEPVGRDAPVEAVLDEENDLAEVDEVIPDPLQDDDEPVEDMSKLNIPSWQEIIASLHRPER